MSDVPVIFFEITDRCNHACFYCCKRFRGRPGLTMSKARLDRILALPKSALVISGGEPSLVRDEVAYVLERADAPVSINTNLIGWTPADLRNMAGRVALNIAVPSLFEEEYRSITGSDDFRRLLTNLDHADRGSTLTVIVHERNRERLGLSVERLAARGFARFALQPAYGLEESERRTAVEAIETVWRRHRNLDIRFVSPWPGADASPVPCTHRCDAGSGRIVILSNGAMVPCACGSLPALGHLDEGDFEAARSAGAAFHQSFPPARRELCKGYAGE